MSPTPRETAAIELNPAVPYLGVDDEQDTAPDFARAVSAVPDGGYGWIIVFACAIETFWVNGWMGTWGIIQAALLQSSMSQISPSTLSFVGSLGGALLVALGLVSFHVSLKIGARASTVIGAFIFSIGTVVSGFAVGDIAGLFLAAGVSYGIGASLMFTVSNSLPVQWFSSRLGTANGIIKLGGGIGATVLAIAIQKLIETVGVAWTFRILGFLSIATAVPAALLIREHEPRKKVRIIDMSLFKNAPFCYLFFAGAVGVFPLFVPPFFLPLFAHSVGLSASQGAGVVACFNACTAVGRLGSGFACDRAGSVNTMLLASALNAVSLLAIWPVSDSFALLMLFAVLSGISNGAFFVTTPTSVGRVVSPDKAAVAMGMAITGWTFGYLVGTPIAGFLITAAGANKSDSIVQYRAAIFYAGGTEVLSTVFVLAARFKLDHKLFKIL